MLKLFIATTTFLLIQDASETIHCTHVILELTMLTQYPLHNNKTHFIIDHALYKLHKTKIAFENYCPIDAKLFQPTFKDPKFHALTLFVESI